MKKHLLLGILSFSAFCGLSSPVSADYPIASHRYLADPGALVHDGRVYLYCSNDDDNPVEGGYKIRSVVCVSSSDMKNWTDHGVVFSAPEGADWARNTWAPSPIERDGKFFLYFGNGGNGIGVASSATPTGPFKDAKGSKLITNETPGVMPAEKMWLFDPMAFIDDDGQAYLYFGGNGENNIRVIKLKRDMIKVDGPATSMFAKGFFEAAWMHKYNGVYYFSYSTNPQNGMRIDYLKSDKPTTGFTYGGILAGQPPINNNNNHQAIFNFKGQWYEAYHNRAAAKDAGIPGGFKRNLALEYFNHKADGSIEQVTFTPDGVPQVAPLNPYQARVEAETMNAQKGIKTQVSNAGGMNVCDIDNGDWIKVKGVDFGVSGAKRFTASVASAKSGGKIELRLGSPEGKLIGVCEVPITGGDQTWKSATCSVTDAQGVQDLYFKFVGTAPSMLNIDWWQFSTQ
ncbi:carbohydrate-binding protein [bacterium]|nr:MAG: carbohydrate-binding protein [bacterium]